MNGQFVILITDRNRHVRDFLRRELAAEGYRVLVARDGREVLACVQGEGAPDLIVLDLEIPMVHELSLLERLRKRANSIPVVIHTFLTEWTPAAGEERAAAIVEKSENTHFLKVAVRDMLKEFYPRRFSGDAPIEEDGIEGGDKEAG